MKVISVVIHFKPHTAFTAPLQMQDCTTTRDLHYIVRDGMATVNYVDVNNFRRGVSFPIADIAEVQTKL